eukprot:302841-Amphidinium_carterae.1
MFDEVRQRSYIVRHPTSQYEKSSPQIKRIYDGFETEDYVEKQRKKIKEVRNRGLSQEELPECQNSTTLLQRLLSMSLHYAPDFFKTLKEQKRDDLRAQNWDEAQVRGLEAQLQGQHIMELYIVLPEHALRMWITCGKIPTSYMQNYTDPRHTYYNFHREVHFAITDYMNIYMYSMPTDFPMTRPDFTDQDHYFVAIHATERLLMELKQDLETRTSRTDLARWYARKDYDVQFQIKAGHELERLGGNAPGRNIEIGKYMEIKVAYRQIHKTVIENKTEYKLDHYHDYSVITSSTHLDEDYAVKMTIDIFRNEGKKNEANNPPTNNRFFVFLLQHYRDRFQNIFQRAGVTVEDYNQTLDYFDKRGSAHFNRVNRRDLREMRYDAPTAEERELSQHYIHGLPRPVNKNTSSIAEEENYDDRDSMTRTSIGTSLKRKSEMNEKDAKKISTGAHTVIILNNPTIHHFSGTTASPRSLKGDADAQGSQTVQSTPRAT